MQRANTANAIPANIMSKFTFRNARGITDGGNWQ